MQTECVTVQGLQDAERKEKMMRALKIAYDAAKEARVFKVGVPDSTSAAIAILAAKIYEGL